MWSKDKPVHMPSCRHRTPIRTPYSVTDGVRGSDRMFRTREWSKAVELANKRAMTRGRQTVRQHTGWMLKRVWVVQDVEGAV